MSQTTFWNLLKENKIEIPIIQRDYAQGREGKEYLRQTFLESLKEALDENKVLKLDFVYGSAENGVLQPLDGQQRLTTLWLLHWYMAMRAGKLHEAGDALKKFTYETRISSREFCEELCKAENFESFDGNNIVSYITSQTWFYSSWKQDPTIQSMLRMLGGTQIKGKSGNDIPDGIEEVFGESSDFEKYWDKLESDNAPVVFYYLPLKDFGLSDDLYIKMNARGKQLTNFENFKADLVGYIKKKANEDETWEKFLQRENNVGIPIKLDTEWTDIFWRNKTDDGRIDEIYFAFLNRYFLHYAIANLDANENSPIWKLYGDELNDTALSYDNGFQMYADIIEKKLQVETSQDQSTSEEQNTPEKNLLEKLSALFANLKQIVDKVVKDQTGNDIQSINDKIRSYLPEWFSSFDFIPQYNKNKNGEYEVSKDSFGNNLYKVTTLTQPQRVVFFGICRYLEECKSFDEGQFKRWMRVVCNLTENNAISDPDAMRSRIKLINILSSHCTDIYGFLSDNKSEIKSNAAKEQSAEEIEKARQILTGNYNGNIADLKGKTWEDVIIESENFAFFNGAIRFLFRNENGEWDWTDFDTKWGNAQRYFDKDGVCDSSEINYKTDATVLKAVLYHVEDFDNKIEPQKFVLDNKSDTWKNNILLSSDWANAVHQVLMGNLETKKRDEDCLLYQSLYNSNLLNYVANSMPGSRINKIGRCKFSAIYLPSKRTGIIPDNNNDNNEFSRNKILSVLEKESIIEINPDIVIASDKNDKIYKGWHVQFKYGSYDFMWTADNWISIIGQPDDGFYLDEKEIKENGFQEELFREELDKRIETRNPNKS